MKGSEDENLQKWWCSLFRLWLFILRCLRQIPLNDIGSLNLTVKLGQRWAGFEDGITASSLFSIDVFYTTHRICSPNLRRTVHRSTRSTRRLTVFLGRVRRPSRYWCLRLLTRFLLFTFSFGVPLSHDKVFCCLLVFLKASCCTLHIAQSTAEQLSSAGCNNYCSRIVLEAFFCHRI